MEMEHIHKSREEIINSLLTIQQVCVKSKDCCDCPFWCQNQGNQVCMISYVDPVHWRINDVEPPWKAFKASE